MTPNAFLYQLANQWRRRQMIRYALQAAGLAILFTVLLYRFAGFPLWTGAAWFALFFGVRLLANQSWRVSEPIIARHLNRHFPELEESCELLLKPPQSLRLLEKWQAQKLLVRLPQLPRNQLLPMTFGTPMIWLGGCLAFAALLWWFPLPNTDSIPDDAQTTSREELAVKPLPPEIKRLQITIQPPKYTGKLVRKQTQPEIRAEAGATVQWQLTLTQPTDSILLILNEKEEIQFKNLDGKRTTFTATQVLAENGFYQFRFGGNTSDYYKIEIIPDAPPTVNVTAPAQHTEIPFGQPTSVPVLVSVGDDYGIREAFMVATVAKGSGEAVKFREEKISFNAWFKPFQKKASLRKLLDLKQMDMAPGDELYFFVQVRDNHAQETRSEVHFISLADTAAETSLTTLSMGVNPVPEYFRSQRQIIIDTEKLLRNQRQIEPAEFRERSNSIGIDQKVLRLRYGKFLGEEFESTIGQMAGKEILDTMKQFGPALGGTHYIGDGHDHSKDEALIEAYMHLHDNAEEATFFEPVLKIKLKNALAQMWEAELRLRTHRPKAALPFAYQALKLLKDVQQQSRAYVSKTGFEPPPLKPQETRLTGELDKITQPTNQQNTKTEIKFPSVREALAVLTGLRPDAKLTANQTETLERAGTEMGSAAIEQPGKYLKALQNLREIITLGKQNQPVRCATCIRSVTQACWRLLPEAEKNPQLSGTLEHALSRQYFEQLNP